MDISVHGLSPGNTPREKVNEVDKLEQARLQQEIATEKRKIQHDEANHKSEKKEEKPPIRDFVMSSTDMKELLLMMGSRGSSKTVERLVELTRKEKELLAKQGR